MNYLQALAYASRRKDADVIRRKLNLARYQRERLTIELARVLPGPERERIWWRRTSIHRRIDQLESRLRQAEGFAVYDWDNGEREFVEWVREAITRPGVFETWRRRGVPLRVLLEARRKAEKCRDPS